MMKTIVSAILLGILSSLGLAPAGLAATATVSVGSTLFAFTPATTNINTGDQVVWVWAGTFHSTTSGTVSGTVATPDGLWDSGLITSLPHSFTNTFNNAGTFPYYCSFHFNSGMKGTIIVAAPNSPPVVTITNPVSGTVLAAPANVTIQASATDDGTVTNVQFLVGSNTLTNRTIAPYSATTNNLGAGSYTFSAIASDNLGVKATNTVSVSVVTPSPITIGASARTSPTNFQFSYAADIGLRYIVQRSTNLLAVNWLTLATNLAASNPVNFADTNATASPGFYRVGRLPNP